MATEIVMPQMGADMQEGTLLRWLKQPGDTIRRGDVIAEIETDKANVEIESFEDGVLTQTLAAEGQVVPVGEVIALIGQANGAGQATPRPAEAVSAAPAAQPGLAAAPSTSDGGAVRGSATVVAEPPAPVSVPAVAPSSEREQQRTPPPGAEVSGPGQRLRVSPVARNIAEELGIDLTGIQGSGPDGRIMRKDLERVAGQRQAQPPAPAPRVPTMATEATPGTPAQVTAPAAPLPAAPAQAVPVAPTGQGARPSLTAPAPAIGAGATVPLSKMRQAIARRMAQSKREAPHYYVTAEVDMTEAMAFRATLNQAADGAVKVSVNDLIVKACASLLAKHTAFNAFYSDSGLQFNARINVCIAIALPDGLIAPALLDTGGKSLGAIAHDAHDLAERARGGALRGPELTDGTFTISNLGMFGIETLIPIIQPPQSAVLGVGAVQEKPAVRDGAIVIRQLMQVALAADHRVTDGAQGGEFLRDLKDLLEHPLRLAL